MYHVYILRCSNGSLYVGHTGALETRLQSHASGSASAHTAKHRPVTLAYSEQQPTRPAAIKREREIKRWTHAKKEARFALRDRRASLRDAKTPTLIHVGAGDQRVAAAHARVVAARHLEPLGAPAEDGPPAAEPTLEHSMIQAALELSSGSVTLAARRIGWTRQKLYRRMGALGVSKG